MITLPVLARHRHRRLVVEIGELHDEQRTLQRVLRILAIHVHRDRLVLPLLTGPARDEEMIAVLGDAVEMADNAADLGGRGRRRPEACREGEAQRCRTQGRSHRAWPSRRRLSGAARQTRWRTIGAY